MAFESKKEKIQDGVKRTNERRIGWVFVSVSRTILFSGESAVHTNGTKWILFCWACMVCGEKNGILPWPAAHPGGRWPRRKRNRGHGARLTESDLYTS